MKQNRKKSKKVIGTHKKENGLKQFIKNNKIPIILISAIWSIFTTDILERIANMPIIWKNFEENYLYNKKLDGLWFMVYKYKLHYRL